VEALWRTLVADTFLDKQPAAEECGAHSLHLASAFVGRAQLNTRKQQKAPASIPPELGLWRKGLLKLSHRAAKIKGMFWGDQPNDLTCWIRLFELEPRRSRYGASAAMKYVESLEANLPPAGQVAFAPFCAEFVRQAKATVGRRHLVRTNGKLIGVAPLDSRLGDEVWILAGASTPFVLRPLENGHRQLIGNAYIHGMMHSEVASLGLNLEEIILA
jgi:hypothetical protein